MFLRGNPKIPSTNGSWSNRWAFVSWTNRWGSNDFYLFKLSFSSFSLSSSSHTSQSQTTIRFGPDRFGRLKKYTLNENAIFVRMKNETNTIYRAPNLIGFLLLWFTIVLLDFCWISPRRGEKIPTNINARFHFVGKTILWYPLVENFRQHRHNFTQNGWNKCSKNN